MDKNTKLLIALPFLMTTAVVVLWPNFKKPDIRNPVPRAYRAPSEIFPEKKELLALIDEDTAYRDAMVETDWGGRNPFQIVNQIKPPPSPANEAPVQNPPEEAPKKTPEVVPPKKLPELSGILWNAHKPSAILDDKVVGVGDHFDGFVIKSILPDRVILSEGPEDRTILLHNSLGPEPAQPEGEVPDQR